MSRGAVESTAGRAELILVNYGSKCALLYCACAARAHRYDVILIAPACRHYSVVRRFLTVASQVTYSRRVQEI